MYSMSTCMSEFFAGDGQIMVMLMRKVLYKFIVFLDLNSRVKRTGTLIYCHTVECSAFNFNCQKFLTTLGTQNNNSISFSVSIAT